MNKEYSVSLKRIIDEIGLKEYYMPQDPQELMVYSNSIDRPGLQLVGHLDFFDNTQIVVLGMTEFSFLNNLSEEDRLKHIEPILSRRPPAVVVARDITPSNVMLDCCKKYEVPLLTTTDDTSALTAALVSFLNVELAPRITRHGVLVEVYGEGMSLLGESGVGKSETAIELVKRGHRLIADDAVEIRRVSDKSLVGTAPDNIRHFIELRGIGIINASRIFGAGAVKLTEKIDLIINIEQWDVNKTYDRMGLESQTTSILDLEIPSLTIPVKPGRNLAVIIEVAAMNHRQKKLGYNAAEDLLKKLGMTDDVTDQGGEAVDPF